MKTVTISIECAEVVCDMASRIEFYPGEEDARKELQAAISAAKAAQGATAAVWVDDTNACAVCGWGLDLRDNPEQAIGCIRGDCSLRPRPKKPYSPERALLEAANQPRFNRISRMCPECKTFYLGEDHACRQPAQPLKASEERCGAALPRALRTGGLVVGRCVRPKGHDADLGCEDGNE